MLAAEATFSVLHEGSNMETYWDSLRSSWVWKELHGARNYRPVSNTIDYCLLLSKSVLVLQYISYFLMFISGIPICIVSLLTMGNFQTTASYLN